MKKFILPLSFLILGAFLRFYELDSVPIGFSGHSIVHAELRLRLYDLIFQEAWTRDTFNRILDTALGEQHGPQSLLEALFMPLYGSGFHEIRLFEATLGILSLIAAYLCGFAAGGTQLGNTLLFFTAISPWNIIASRYGDSEHILIFLHAFLLLLSVTKALETRSIRWAFLYGALLGLSLYIYAVNQFLSALVLPISLIAVWKIYALRQLWMPFLATYLGGIIAAGPQLYLNYQRGNLLLIRSSVGSPLYEPTKFSDLWIKTKQLFNQFFILCDDPWYTIGTHGALQEYGFLFSLIGLFWLFTKSSHGHIRTFKWITTACVLLGSLPSIMTPETPFRRASIAYIGLNILASAGAAWFLQLSYRRVPKILTFLFTALCISVLVRMSFDSVVADISPYESTSNRVPVAIVRFLASNTIENSKIFLSDRNFKEDSETYDKFLWFELASKNGEVRKDGLRFPEIYLRKNDVPTFLNEPTARILIPEYYMNEFNGIISSLPEAIRNQMEVENVSDTKGFPFFIYRRRT